MRLLVYGYGFVGRALARRMAAAGWDVAATWRDPSAAKAMRAEGVEPLPAEDKQAIAERLADVQAVLVTPPPGPEGCPALQVLVPALAKAALHVLADDPGAWQPRASAFAAQFAWPVMGKKLRDILQAGKHPEAKS